MCILGFPFEESRVNIDCGSYYIIYNKAKVKKKHPRICMYLYSDVLMVDFRELMMMSVVGNIELGPRQAFMANVITPAARTTHSNYMCKKMQEISDGTAPTRVDKLLRQRGDAPSFSAVKKGPFCPPSF